MQSDVEKELPNWGIVAEVLKHHLHELRAMSRFHWRGANAREQGLCNGQCGDGGTIVEKHGYVLRWTLLDVCVAVVQGN